MYRILLAGLLFWAGVACAGDVNPMRLRTFGADNPAIIYVFTSASCPHCAHYHKAVLPALKTEFAETGRAQLKIVDMPYDAPALSAMQLGRCLDEAAYGSFMAQVYDNQAVWGYGAHPKRVLKEYAAAVGMTEAAADRCWANEALKKRIIEQRDNLGGLYRVRGLPTTVVVKGHTTDKWAGTDEEEILNGVRKALITK